jgi:hypothetical protein
VKRQLKKERLIKMKLNSERRRKKLKKKLKLKRKESKVNFRRLQG